MSSHAGISVSCVLTVLVAIAVTCFVLPRCRGCHKDEENYGNNIPLSGMLLHVQPDAYGTDLKIAQELEIVPARCN
ncbi:hypothetical protein F5051DRAFT_395816 [Lentinula edodes]|nr:hypothetical protein F5051DRAFT_395816 [Lentinula edodes]